MPKMGGFFPSWASILPKFYKKNNLPHVIKLSGSTIMKTRLSEVPPFKKKDKEKDNKTKNPRTIIHILWEIFLTYFGTYPEAKRQLSANSTEKRIQQSITEKTVRKIHRDEINISYYHLEAYANYLGIPTGVLLLFSRMRSNSHKYKEEGKTDFLTENREILEALKKISETTKEDDTFSIETLIKWADLMPSIKRAEKNDIEK